jgi:hypothetical protein
LSDSNTQGPATVACTLAGHASCRIPVEDLAALRRQPGLPCGEPLSANFLKHADEQTVIALAAVFEAIRRHGLAAPGGPSPFRDWGVLAAPRFLGRPLLTAVLPRFQSEGAWGVSPHVIPHHSLHSISGTVSQALKIHGPNFGVGGGPGSEMEGLLTAVVLLHDMKLPGVWLVLSRLEPEGDSDPETGRAGPGTMACGLALALAPLGSFAGRPSLELTLAPGTPPSPALTMNRLEELLAGRAEPWAIVPLGGAGQLVLRRSGLPLSGPHPSFFVPGASATFAPQRSDQP